jgi:hypothetical protein
MYPVLQSIFLVHNLWIVKRNNLFQHLLLAQLLFLVGYPLAILVETKATNETIMLFLLNRSHLPEEIVRI